MQSSQDALRALSLHYEHLTTLPASQLYYQHTRLLKYLNDNPILANALKQIERDYENEQRAWMEEEKKLMKELRAYEGDLLKNRLFIDEPEVVLPDVGPDPEQLHSSKLLEVFYRHWSFYDFKPATFSNYKDPQYRKTELIDSLKSQFLALQSKGSTLVAQINRTRLSSPYLALKHLKELEDLLICDGKKKLISSWGENNGDEPTVDDHLAERHKQTLLALKLLYLELQLKVNSRRSLQLLLERFRQRCETIDRERLRDLIENESKGGKDKNEPEGVKEEAKEKEANQEVNNKTKSSEPRPQIERLLQNEMQLWLFDQEITFNREPLTGSTRADFIVPSEGWYIEVKQVSSNDSGLINGLLSQIPTTERDVRMLCPDHHISQIAYVVFAVGNRRVEFDFKEVDLGAGYLVYPIVIDVSTAPRGSTSLKKSEKPIHITQAEVLKNHPSAKFY